MKRIFFALPGNEALCSSLASKCRGEPGVATIRHFPDGETYVRIESEVKERNVYLICTLDHPDDKLLPLFFLAKAAKEAGAEKIYLVAPYLAYMRQDKQFNPGEAVTSSYFATLISSFCDALITVDPHLHRRSALSEIYTIPTSVLHAADTICEWIKQNIQHPVIIGPDIESEQWVSQAAIRIGAPYLILEKVRHGDEDVEISDKGISSFKSFTPVLLDDIISTARTMIKTIEILRELQMKAPVCVGIHGVFSNTAYQDLMEAGAAKIITTNTIPHPSNLIWIDELLSKTIITIENEN